MWPFWKCNEIVDNSGKKQTNKQKNKTKKKKNLEVHEISKNQRNFQKQLYKTYEIHVQINIRFVIKHTSSEIYSSQPLNIITTWSLNLYWNLHMYTCCVQIISPIKYISIDYFNHAVLSKFYKRSYQFQAFSVVAFSYM